MTLNNNKQCNSNINKIKNKLSSKLLTKTTTHCYQNYYCLAPSVSFLCRLIFLYIKNTHNPCLVRKNRSKN